MIVRINSPVLVPFGSDPRVIDYLTSIEKEVYVAPQYKFWGMYLELLLSRLPSEYTLEYIKQKYIDDFSGIVRKSKYYGIMKFLFNKPTADTIDKIYQIDLGKHEKLVLGLFLSKVLQTYMDDAKKIKSPLLDKKTLEYSLNKIHSYFTWITSTNRSVKIIKEPLTNQQFPTIYDKIERKSRLYTPHFLGFIRLFTGETEIVTKWNDRLNHVVKNNLMQGGHIILEFPSEYEEKINKIMNENNFEKIHKYIWQKPDIKVTKLDKGIKRYY